jgi:antitoxin MazE
MSKTFRTRIIKIGDDQGVLIPELLLKQSGIDTEVEIELEGDHLTIRQASDLPIRQVAHPRAGWAQSFAEMARNHDDVLLDEIK